MIYEVSIILDKLAAEGLPKRVKEQYLVEAVSFADAEKRAAEYIAPYVSGEVRISAIKQSNVAEVVTCDDEAADKFYKVKHSFITIDESRTGSLEKKQAQFIIFQAASVDDAKNKYYDHVKGWLGDLRLEAVAETNFFDYVK